MLLTSKETNFVISRLGFGCSDHNIVEFGVWLCTLKVNSKAKEDVMQRILLGATSQMKHMIRKCQHEFTKAKLCLTNLIAFYSKVACLVDVGQAMDIVCLCFSKVSSVISHRLLVKLLCNSLDKLPGQWVGH